MVLGYRHIQNHEPFGTARWAWGLNGSTTPIASSTRQASASFWGLNFTGDPPTRPLADRAGTIATCTASRPSVPVGIVPSFASLLMLNLLIRVSGAEILNPTVTPCHAGSFSNILTKSLSPCFNPPPRAGGVSEYGCAG